MIHPDVLAAVFKESMARHPRSLQEALGPSEIGDSCARKLAFKVAGVPGRRDGAGWPAWVGTQAHVGAQAAFEADNARLGRERWLTESKVDIGMVLDLVISGTCDLFDTDTGTVVDFKFVGPTSLRNYRVNGLSPVYRSQIHGYGAGMVNAGHEVTDVGIYLLPRDGQLSAATLVAEPYDPDVVRRTLKRLGGIVAAVRTHGDEAIPLYPTAASYCRTCPFFVADTTNLRAECPGHVQRDAESTLTFSEK